MFTLKAGDRVYSNIYGYGNIIYIDSQSYLSLLINFDKVILGGHNGWISSLVHGDAGHCWWCAVSDVIKIKENEYKVNLI